MPPRAKPNEERKEQRCANPLCKGIPICQPGSHITYGAYKPWAIRPRCCPECGWKWDERFEVILDSIVIPTAPPEPDPNEKPDPQRQFSFDLSQ